MADERMSEEEIAVLLRRGALGTNSDVQQVASDFYAELRRERARADAMAEAVKIEHALRLADKDEAEGAIRYERAKLDDARAELRRERARADNEAGVAAQLRDAAHDLDEMREILGAREEPGAEETAVDAARRVVLERDQAIATAERAESEAAQLKRDRERERDIATRRERDAIVKWLRGSFSADEAGDIADEIEEGNHHG